MYNWHYTSSIFLLGRRSKQTTEMPFTSTLCLTINISQRWLCSDTTLQTLNNEGYPVSRLDPKFLTALKITLGLLLSYLCNIVSIFQAHLHRDRALIQEKGRNNFLLIPHMSLKSIQWCPILFSFGTLTTVVRLLLLLLPWMQTLIYKLNLFSKSF